MFLYQEFVELGENIISTVQTIQNDAEFSSPDVCLGSIQHGVWLSYQAVHQWPLSRQMLK
jgi:hypothetical protein